LADFQKREKFNGNEKAYCDVKVLFLIFVFHVSPVFFVNDQFCKILISKTTIVNS